MIRANAATFQLEAASVRENAATVRALGKVTEPGRAKAGIPTSAHKKLVVHRQSSRLVACPHVASRTRAPCDKKDFSLHIGAWLRQPMHFTILLKAHDRSQTVT